MFFFQQRRRNLEATQCLWHFFLSTLSSYSFFCLESNQLVVNKAFSELASTMASWHMNSLYILLLFATANCLSFFPFSPSSSSDDNSDAAEWTQYHNQQALEAKFADIAKKCPHHTQVYSIGKSVQGRDLVVLEFSTNPGTHESCKFESVFDVLVF